MPVPSATEAEVHIGSLEPGQPSRAGPDEPILARPVAHAASWPDVRNRCLTSDSIIALCPAP